MKIKKLFNLTLLLFVTIVPLVPLKYKYKFIPLSADFIIGGILILLGIIYLIFNYKNEEKQTELLGSKELKFLSVFIVLFGLISFASVLYALNKGAAISEGIRFMEYVLIFYFILIICDKKTIKSALKLFYVSMIAASIFGLFQFVFSKNTEFLTGGFFGRTRIYATFENPNYWGAAVNIVIFYPLLNILEKKNIKTNLLIFTLFFFNLFFCSTRGSWLGFAIGVFVIGIIKYRKQAVYSLGLFALMFILPITRNRFLQVLNISERFQLWKTGLMMFKENPLLGVGNGNYIYRYERFVKREHRELYLGRSTFSVHNSYIKMLAELGIFGGITFTVMYGSLFNLVVKVYKYSIKYKKVALAFIGFGASYLFQNLFNNLVFIPQLNVFVWIIIALLYKGYYIEKQTNANLQ